ncbi:MAG: FAD-dependent oxidoreductase, partial [Pseudomonadota bacterium]
MAELPDSAEIVVIGGGVIGLSVAYHLAKLGCRDVIVLERHKLTSGTSWHAAGIIGPLRASANLTHLSAYATKLLPKIEQETGQSTGYRQTGGFWLAQSEERMRELRRICDVGTMSGLNPKIMTPGEVADRLRIIHTRDLAGGMWVPEDGQANPVDVCMAYAKGARDRGVRIFEDTSVATVHHRGGAVSSVEAGDGHIISCKKIVNCGGAWAKRLAQSSGISIPLQAVEHMYVVTEPIPALPQPFPVIRDLEGRIYIKEDAGRLVLGGFEPNAKIWHPDGAGPDAPFLELPEDWDQFEPFMQAGLKRIPGLSSAGIQHFMTGPESFTPDTKQVMGEAPECRNYFVAAGFNSIGIISSAGTGKVMAEWVSDGACPMDIWDLDIARFEPRHSGKAFQKARVQEAVASQFEMHWPYKQMKTGRGLARSPFHKAWAEQGAVFGAPTGFERPLYFGPAQRYTYGHQRWWPSVEQEIKALTERGALLELTPFGKFLIEGRHALRFLQRVCPSNMDIPVGRLIYTQMLNARGRIEADVTVMRLSEDRFLMVSGAATRIKDQAWLNRSVRGDRVAITDVTSSYAVLGVMGPEARNVLSALTPDDLANKSFPYGHTQEIEIGHARVRACRVSYVGELGW